MNVHEWTKVVTHPLGLTAFALFLVFWLLSKAKKPEDRRFWRPVFLFAAICCLLGGLSLSYMNVTRPANSSTQKEQPQAPQRQENKEVQQNTKGAGSPAIQGVQGNVTVNVDQSSGKGKPSETKKKKE